MRFAPLVGLLLAADPGPTIRLRDESGAAKAVRELNCIGPGITCSASSTYGTITVPGGGGSVPSACPAGQCVTSNGSALVCTGTINATTAATATSLAANPTDCSAGQYAHTIAANGDLTCSTPPGTCSGGSAGNLQTNGSGSCSAYAGTSCSNSFPRSLSASGAATCSAVDMANDTTGILPYAQVGAAPPNLSVQFNNGGVLGGATNVMIDGGLLGFVPLYGPPPAPTGNVQLLLSHAADSGFPGLPVLMDQMFGSEIPYGSLAWFTRLGTSSSWRPEQVSCNGANSTLETVNNAGATTAGSVGSPAAWANTSLYTRSSICPVSTTGSGASSASWRANRDQAWVGDGSGHGGFWYHARLALITIGTKMRFAAGMFDIQGDLTTTTDPDQATDSIYFGCNAGAANISICSNDNSGAATCSDLGASFPCRTAQSMYDFWLFAPASASAIYYWIVRLDSPASATGMVTADLPRSTVRLNHHEWVNTGDAGSQCSIGLESVTVMANMN